MLEVIIVAIHLTCFQKSENRCLSASAFPRFSCSLFKSKAQKCYAFSKYGIEKAANNSTCKASSLKVIYFNHLSKKDVMLYNLQVHTKILYQENIRYNHAADYFACIAQPKFTCCQYLATSGRFKDSHRYTRLRTSF